MAPAIGPPENRGPDDTRVHALKRALEARHYKPKTIKVYLYWIQRYVRFHSSADPSVLRENEVNEFLTYLAAEENVSASTQNQALAALLAYYEHVVRKPLDRVKGVIRAPKSTPAKVALSKDEVERLLSCMEGVSLLVTQLMYGCGMRVTEALQLRVKELDFDRGEILVKDGKGGKDRVTMLPAKIREPLKEYLRWRRLQHQADLAKGLGTVSLPNALVRKYPNANRSWGWQWVFPATRHHLNLETGLRQRHHLHPSVVQKAVKAAAARAGITKHVTPHTLRHTFATHLLDAHYDILTIQELLGHNDIRTTEQYLHVLNRGGYGVMSPLDATPDRGPIRAPYTDDVRRDNHDGKRLGNADERPVDEPDGPNRPPNPGT